MAERSVSVRLSANVASYLAAMKAAEASTIQMAGVTQAQMARVGSQMQNVGRNMTRFVSVPIVAAGAAAVVAAVSWESAWAGVTKTVDGTAAQMGVLEQGLRDMTKEVSASHGEIAAVAEAAGALGIAQQDILGFTRVMVDLGETTNLTSDQAATAIAQLMNVMNTAPGDVDNLGSALVALGNNGASTEAQIIEMAQRISGAGEIVGLTEDQVLSFANAIASTGIEAEAGGSAFSRVISDMSKAVTLGGSKLETFAATAGMSASQFATAFRENPSQAIVAFIDGLAQMESTARGSSMPTLVDLGLQGIRTSDLLNRLAGSGDLVTESLETGSQAWADNTALADEAAKRYDTAGARFEMVRNKIMDLFIDLGNIMLPAIEAVVGAVGELAEAFQALPAPVQAAVGGFLGLLAVVGPIVFLAGSFIKNLVAIKAAMTALSLSAGTLGVGLLAVGAAIAAGVLIYKAFTDKQHELDARSREVGEALGEQTAVAWDLADAAEGAAGAIDGLTLANDALGRALAATGEDGEKIRLAFGTLRLSIEDVVFWMDSLQGSDAVRGSALEEMARQAGVAEPYIAILAETIRTTDDNGSSLHSTLRYALVDGLNMSDEAAWNLAESLMPIASQMEEIDDQSQKFDSNDSTRTFLRLAAGSDTLANNLIILAETQTGLSRNGEHTRSVMAALLEIISALPPEAEAAARAALGLSGATGEAADAALGAVDPFAAAEAGLIAYHQAQTKAADGYRLLVTESKDVVSHLGDMSDATLLAGTAFDTTAQTVQNVIDGIAEAGVKSGETAGKFADLGGAADDAAGGFGALEDAVNDLFSAFDAIMNPADDLRATARAVHSTFADVVSVFEDAEEPLITAAGAFILTSEAGRTAEETYIAARDAIYEHGTEMMRNGESAEAAAGDIAYNTESLNENMRQAGYTEEQIAALNAEYFLTPAELLTELMLIGAAQAAAEIAHHKGLLGEIPGKQTTTIEVLTNSTDVTNVKGQLDSIVNQIRTAYIGVTGPGTKAVTGVIGRAALGSYVAADGLWQLHGNEAVMPLDNPGRMRELADDPRIGGPLLAALAGHMTPAPAMSGWNGPPPAAPGNSTSLSFGDIHVGDRRDAAPFVDALKETLFVANYAS